MKDYNFNYVKNRLFPTFTIENLPQIAKVFVIRFWDLLHLEWTTNNKLKQDFIHAEPERLGENWTPLYGLFLSVFPQEEFEKVCPFPIEIQTQTPAQLHQKNLDKLVSIIKQTLYDRYNKTSSSFYGWNHLKDILIRYSKNSDLSSEEFLNNLEKEAPGYLIDLIAESTHPNPEAIKRYFTLSLHFWPLADSEWKENYLKKGALLLERCLHKINEYETSWLSPTQRNALPPELLFEKKNDTEEEKDEKRNRREQHLIELHYRTLNEWLPSLLPLFSSHERAQLLWRVLPDESDDRLLKAAQLDYPLSLFNPEKVTADNLTELVPHLSHFGFKQKDLLQRLEVKNLQAVVHETLVKKAEEKIKELAQTDPGAGLQYLQIASRLYAFSLNHAFEWFCIGLKRSLTTQEIDQFLTLAKKLNNKRLILVIDERTGKIFSDNLFLNAFHYAAIEQGIPNLVQKIKESNDPFIKALYLSCIALSNKSPLMVKATLQQFSLLPNTKIRYNPVLRDP